jgi:hypothetical protein
MNSCGINELGQTKQVIQAVFFYEETKDKITLQAG